MSVFSSLFAMIRSDKSNSAAGGRSAAFLLLTLTVLLAALFSAGTVFADGTWDCGDPAVNDGKNVTCTLSTTTGRLTVSGSGDMADYTGADNTPWSGVRNNIQRIMVKENVTSLGSYAFADLEKLRSVSIERNEKSLVLGTNVFAGSGSGNSRFITATLIYTGTVSFAVTPENVGFSISDNTKLNIDVNGNSKAALIPIWDCGAVSGTVTCTLSLDGTFTVSGTGDMKNYDNETDRPWYGQREEIRTAVFGTGVKSVGIYAFENCGNLTSVSLPGSLTSIGKAAFRKCTSLTAVSLPESLTSIGNEAFLGTGLKSVSIPTGVTAIRSTVFSECKSLESVSLPDSLTAIGEFAFTGCTNLTEISLPESLTSIGKQAFAACSALETIIIRRGGKDLELREEVFYGSNAEEAKLSYAGSSSAIFIILDQGGNQHADFIIDGNTLKWSSTTLTTPAKLTATEGWYCGDPEVDSGHNLICALSDNTLTVSGSGDMADYEDADAAPWAGIRNNIQRIVVKEDVASLGSYAFANMEKLRSVSIERNEKSLVLGKNVFVRSGYDDSFITAALKYTGTESSVSFAVIPEDAGFSVSGTDLNFDPKNSTSEATLMRVLGSWDCGAVSGTVTCTLSADGIFTATGSGDMKNYEFVYDQPWTDQRGKIRKAEIGSGVTSIGGYAFSLYTNLKSVSLPEGLSSIGGYAFYGCTNLTSVSLPEGLSSIGGYAFYGCTNLTSVSLPEGLTSIGDYAFSGCTNLKEASFPEGLTSIGEYAFYGCTNLKDVSLPRGLTSIGKYAFYKCSNLTGVSLPRGLTSIGEYVFSYCSNLKEASFPEGLTSIGHFAFWECTNLKEVDFPKSLTSIGEFAFYNCSNLKEVDFPDGLTFIGQFTFYGCENLTAVSLPRDLTSIGNYAFYDCAKLTNVNYDNLQIVRELVMTIGSGNTYLTNAEWHYAASGGVFVLPSQLTTIEKEAFRGLPILALVIPESVKNIGDAAFASCPDLRAVIFLGGDVRFGSGAAAGSDQAVIYYPAGSSVETWCRANHAHCVGY